MVFYNVIACVDSDFGLGKNNSIPWNIKDDMDYFKNMTTNNIVIMGRLTYESIGKALPNRINIVISNTLNQNDYIDIIIVKSVIESIIYVESLKPIDKNVYIIGGSNIYKEFLKKKIPYKIYLNKINKWYDCDTYFDHEYTKNYDLTCECIKYCYDKNSDEDEDIMVFFQTYVYNNYDERKYLDLMDKIIKSGISKPDRTSTGTLSVFGETIKYDVRNNIIPLLTTKKMFFRGIVEELLFFISGKTDSNILKNKGVNIWNGNTSREFLDNCGLNDYKEGDMGPLYPFQLRHWGAEYKDCDTDYTNKGFDQLLNLINQIKTNPNSRRLLFSYWNPTDFTKTPIPTCFPGNTRVLTINGYKKIKNISINDKVISHSMRVRNINNVQLRFYRDKIYKIKTGLSDNMISTTSEHPFLVKNKWVKAEDLVVGDYLMQNLNTKGNVKKSTMFILMGYYYKLGYRNNILIKNSAHHTTLTSMLGDSTLYKIKHKVNSKYSIQNYDSLFKMHLNRYINDINNEKKLNANILLCGKQNIKYFIEGYLFASQHTNSSYLYENNYANALILQSMSLYTDNVFSINKYYNQSIYMLTMSQNNLVRKNVAYFRINEIDIELDDMPIPVYNLECDVDNTYIVENVIVHNCHILYQYYTDPINNELSCSFYCRSQDYCLGTPFNIASATVLLNIICKLTGYNPGYLIHNMGDTHIYNTFIEKFKSQIKRSAYNFPTLYIKNYHEDINNYTYDDFILLNYNHHKGIKVDMIA